MSARVLLATLGAAAVLGLTGCGVIVGTFTLLTSAGDGGPGPVVDGGDLDAGPTPDAGEVDAGPPPCADGCDDGEGCFVADDGVGICLPSCVDDYDYGANAFRLSDCDGELPCVYRDGNFLCRDTPSLSIDCATAVEQSCVAGDTVLFLGCSAGAPILVECADRCEADADGAFCVADPPPAWTCDAANYGAADGCDCGCGAPDPDCIDHTADSCVYCSGCPNGGNTCTCGWPGGTCAQDIVPDDNTRCAP